MTHQQEICVSCPHQIVMHDCLASNPVKWKCIRCDCRGPVRKERNVSDNISAQQYLLRLNRLLRMVSLNAPPRVIASECLLIAKAASEMGAVPTTMLETARKIAQMIEEARSTPEFRAVQEDARKQEERMAEEVHLPGCPAYEEWIKNSTPGAPGECKCGGSPL